MSVTSLTLVNADTDQDLGTLTNGQVLNLSSLPTRNLNVRANTSPSLVGSVVFTLDGAHARTENGSPYALAGDDNGNYRPWTPAAGSHTLTAAPYGSTGGTGTAGTPLTVAFSVTDAAPPPATWRIGMSNDGNQHDPDDILAVAMQLAIIGEANLQGRFVHLDYNDHLGDNNPSMAAEMTTSVQGAASRWGFPMNRIFDCQTNLNGAINSIRDAINASSASDRFYLVCAGPMEVAWRGIAASDPARRQYCTAISHSWWNNDHADTAEMTHTWAHIQQSGVQTVDIADQNAGFASNDIPWLWLRDSTFEPWRWLFSRKRTGIGGNTFDASDAGMVWYVLFGDEAGNATKVRALFEQGAGNQPPTVSIASPANGSGFTAPATVTITASASDGDGSVAQVDFFVGATLLGSDATSPYSFTWSNVAAGSYSLTARATDNAGAVSTASVQITVNGPTGQVGYKINSGGGAVGAFSADADFSGGTVYATTAAIDLSGVTTAAPQQVYQSERWGNFTYTLGSLTPGADYAVCLHFAEIYWTASGRRVFHVRINGQQVLTNYDIFAEVGARKAAVKKFNATADGSGRVIIQFVTVVDNAKVSGIEVAEGQVPSSSLCINSGGGAVGTFGADAFFTGGFPYATSAAIDTAGVANAAPAAVYQSERYGNFSYTLDGLTPGTAYGLRLHFAEIFWLAPGQRVFHVRINGQPVLTDFDIFAEAGADRAVVREFSAAADANGRIAIQFVTVVDNAKLSGIELSAGATGGSYKSEASHVAMGGGSDGSSSSCGLTGMETVLLLVLAGLLRRR